ncbi:MAG: hypothetical protein KBT30_02810, partial [Clostridiales bacterium]|nr:hypothetical protein [Candidatus Apopatousia equi]
MKKLIKYISLCLCVLVSGIIFCACGENEDGIIKVKKLTLSQTEISLIYGEEDGSQAEFKVSYEPTNATQTQVEFFGYNENLIEFEMKEFTYDTFIVKAKVLDMDTTSSQTTFGVRMKGNKDVQASATVTLTKQTEQLLAPTNIHFDEESRSLVWEDTNVDNLGKNGYILKITDSLGQSQEVYSAGNLGFKNFKKGEQLTVEVMSKGAIDEIDSDYSAPYTFKVLDDIKNFKHENEVLSWDEIDGISGYDLKINLNNIQLNSNINSFDTKNDNLLKDAGKYNIRLTAKASDIIDEETGKTICHCFDSETTSLNVVRFSIPENVEFNEYQFKWGQPVIRPDDTKTIQYKVCEDKGENEKLISTTSNQYKPQSTLSTGIHTYCVMAVGDGINTLSSSFSTIRQITKLPTPQNIKIEDGKIVWDEYSENQSYILNILGNIANINYSDKNNPCTFRPSKNEFDMRGGIYKGSFEVCIAYEGDGVNTLSGDFTKPLRVIKLNNLTNTDFYIENNMLKFTNDENASQYEVILTDSKNVEHQPIYLTTNEMNIDSSVISEGKFSIKVRKIGDSKTVNLNDELDNNVYYLSSELSESVDAELLNFPTLKVINGQLVWNEIKNASKYLLYVDGEIVYDGKQTSYDFEGYDSTEYNVSIKAIGGNVINQKGKYSIGSFDSKESPIKTVIKLSAPVLSVENGEVYSNVENAKIVYDIADGKYVYKAKVVGDGDKDHDGQYLTSDYSNEISIYKIPNVSNFKILDNYLCWDVLDSYTYGEEKSVFNGVKFELKIKDKNSNEVVASYDGTNNNFDLLDEEIDYGTYNAEIRIICDNENYLNGNIVKLKFTKLKKPELSATNIK